MDSINLIHKIVIPSNNSDLSRSKHLLEILKSVSKDDIDTVSKEIYESINNKELVHDLNWAFNALADGPETLGHYENYREALDIITKSGKKLYFLQQ